MGHPEVVTTEHLEFLDQLRETGITNMYGAAPYLMEEFSNLNKHQARNIILCWLETFEERHKTVGNKGCTEQNT